MNDYKIFASIIDDATQKQVEKTANSEAYKGCQIRIMPDCHAGIGCTVGSVIRFNDRVVPNTVGVDIGCGMLVTEIGKVDVDLALLDHIVTKKIPSGFNVHDQPFNIRDWSMSFNAKIDNMDYILRSIGTLGGGNHFIELDEDEDGSKYLVIHSGSRNLGVQVCNYWQKKGIENLTSTSAACKELIARLKAEGRQREIGEALKQIKKPQIDEELAYIEGSDLEAYLADMKQCQEYAVHNRMVMTCIICQAMGWTWINGAQFSTIHNYIDIENKTIRKGAISAQKGEKVIIPMNMRDGSLICVGKGNEDWLCSAPHGAGRIMSRAQAFKQVHMDEFQKSMEGIYSTSVCEGTLDEAPQVYKSADVIRKDIEPTVEILKVIKPIWNFKAKTSENARPPKASK
jgi:RNA-splicing ligase RtcB